MSPTEDRSRSYGRSPASARVDALGGVPEWVRDFKQRRLKLNRSVRDIGAAVGGVPADSESTLAKSLATAEFVNTIERLVSRLGGTEDEAQQTLLGLWTAVVRKNWKGPPGSEEAYAATIAVRAMSRRRRRVARGSRAVSLDGLEEVIRDERQPAPDTPIRVSEALHAAIRFAAELNNEEWDSVVMRHGPGAGETLEHIRGLSPSEQNRLRCVRSRALAKLRRKLRNIGIIDI